MDGLWTARQRHGRLRRFRNSGPGHGHHQCSEEHGGRGDDLCAPLGRWIGSGNNHVCAILSDGSFSCWGKDGYFDAIDYGPYPVPISGVGKVAAAGAGFDNTCVIETDHTVKCWGSNLSGLQLGENGPSGNSATPVVITGLPGGR